MEITLERTKSTKTSTLGRLSVNGVAECFVLEDTDRGLQQDMPLAEIVKKKVYGQTAIPEGRYEIAITWSNRFKKYLPLLLNVPGFEGIRIHAGNTAEHTHGCLLPGTLPAENKVLNSGKAFVSLFAKLKAVEKSEKIFITIQ